MALLNNKVPGRMSFNYYICTGEDPTDYENIKPKVSNPRIKIRGSEPAIRGKYGPRSL